MLAVFAVGAFYLSYISGDNAAAIMLSLLTCTFLLGSYLLLKFERLVAALLNPSFVENFNLPQREISSKLVTVANEIARFFRLIIEFRFKSETSRSDLSYNLRRIGKFALRELDAGSVEVGLMDSASNRWSQILAIGIPKTSNSQAMFAEMADRREPFESQQGHYLVLMVPIKLSGHCFGAIRVELKSGRQPQPNDKRLLQLVASEGALQLVDARFTEELIRLKRASEETTKAKTGFLANLSHEIRGPLGVILNASELMLDGLCGELSEDQQKSVIMVKESSEHLLDLVNDVLDYARLESGKVQPKPVGQFVNHVLQDLGAIIRSQAIEKGHKLIVNECDESAGLLCDKRHLRQILINFLTNAVKYTPNGGEITFGADFHTEGRVKIFVKDTGVGISAANHDKVFTAFERVEADEYSAKQTGTGLGMPLTRKLAEVNGGSVGFTSEPGKGSTFWVMLPQAVVDNLNLNGAGAGDGTAERGKLGSGETVLIVDNDVETRGMLRTYLLDQGFVVVEAGSGRELLSGLKQTPDVALVENDIPSFSGEQVVSTIRSVPGGSGVPIVLLSAKAFEFDIEKFLKLGVDRCLAKPVKLAEIATTVRRLVDERKRLVELNP
jgi:signal transduction histidine kinase/CheY-like chemotaxis protein